jgi:hypothetical protein
MAYFPVVREQDSPPAGTPAGTYTLTVSVTSISLSHSAALTLTLK